MASVMAYVSMALAFSVQGGAAIWWAGVINARVAALEQHRDDFEAFRPSQATDLSRALTAIAVMEERFRRFDEAIGRLDRAVGRLETLEAGP